MHCRALRALGPSYRVGPCALTAGASRARWLTAVHCGPRGVLPCKLYGWDRWPRCHQPGTGRMCTDVYVALALSLDRTFQLMACPLPWLVVPTRCAALGVVTGLPATSAASLLTASLRAAEEAVMRSITALPPSTQRAGDIAATLGVAQAMLSLTAEGLAAARLLCACAGGFRASAPFLKKSVPAARRIPFHSWMCGL